LEHGAAGVPVKYRTIVADPPWNVTAGPPWASGASSQPLDYPTMDVDAIASLPVRELADDRAHLYLWTINKYVEDAYEIARLWGFRPSTLLVWCKNPNGIGLGGTFSLTTEYILFARRGVLTAKERRDSTWWLWRRGPHSAKPEAFLDMVEQVSPPPYLEMFARRQRLGWSTWGNECFDSLGGSIATPVAAGGAAGPESAS
jgi:N6-adenosine-specific RNA methylase IME4